MTWTACIQLRLGDLDLRVELRGGQGPVALIGPNGAGKSTVLRTIAGAHRPDAGQITVGSTTLFDSDAGLDLAPEHRRVGYVPQGLGLFPHLTAGQNVAFGLRGPRNDRQQTARSQLDALDVGHLADRRVRALSGGEAQRVALARALVIQPRILLLDEPLAALDAGARRKTRQLLRARLRSVPTLIVTHDARDVFALAEQVCVIEGGRVVQAGAVAEVARGPITDFGAEFFAALEPLTRPGEPT